VLARFDLRDEQIVSSLEQNVDVNREILIGVGQHQKVQELTVIQEEKPIE